MTLTDPLASVELVEFRAVAERFTADRFGLEEVRRLTAPGAPTDAAWAAVVSMGWTALAVGEEEGGAGMGLAAQIVPLMALGASLAPVPLLAAAWSASLMTTLAEPGAASEVLGAVVDGSAVPSVLRGAGWSGAQPPAVVADSRCRLTGRIPYGLEGTAGGPLLVLAGGPASGLYVLPAGAAGLKVAGRRSIDITRRVVDVSLDAVAAERLHAAPAGAEQIDGAVDRMAVLLAAETVAAAGRAFTITLEYLKTRKQFGHPIGQFQALKHRCADIAAELTTAHELVVGAAEAADGGDARSLALAAVTALCRSATVARKVTEEGIQMHGGIGFTDEAPMGLYYKRALSDGELLASVADARSRLAGLLDEAHPGGA